MLPRYGWSIQISHGRAWPVGQKKPNDFGLFDMHGAVWVWCQDPYRAYPKTGADPGVEDTEVGDDKDAEMRVLRGASFEANLLYVRSACRLSARPLTLGNAGLRLARTYR
jgi:formylglycine-generating enzyme required for sulfatase activity